MLNPIQNAFINPENIYTGVNAGPAKWDPMDLTGEQVAGDRDLPHVQPQDSTGLNGVRSIYLRFRW